MLLHRLGDEAGRGIRGLLPPFDRGGDHGIEKEKADLNPTEGNDLRRGESGSQ